MTEILGGSQTYVQSLEHHHQPSRDHCAVSRDEPLRRQSAANAGRLSGLPCPGDPAMPV